MNKYFSIFENEIPNFTTRIWLSDNFVGQSQFIGRSLDYQNINIPTQFILNGDRMFFSFFLLFLKF